MAVTPWTQRVAASNNSEFMFSKHGTRICTRQQVRTGDSVSDRAHSIAGRRDHERSSLLSPSLTSRARHAQHTGLDYVHADGGRSSQHVVTGRWAISFVGRSCGVSASRPPPPADVGRASRHGDGRPPCVLGASASQHGDDLNAPEGDKVCIALLGCFLGTRVWAAAGRTGQGLAAAADAADHSRKAPTSPRHDDARRGLAGYDHDTSGRRHAAAMSGCSAAVASAVASMASSV